jgi:cyclomaltodextrinase
MISPMKKHDSVPLVPEWVKDAVFYQIFPDRFAKSSRIAKPNNLQPWGAPPTANHYQGGDLLGIVEHLDYLTDLGVTALYLNPIFRSASNHRYHTHDFERVDPLLGGDEALRELVEALHERGLRIILDGVFNHASRGFFQFNDVLENGSASPWVDWFNIKDWPLAPYDINKPANYDSWWGIRALPKLNTDNPQVKEYIFRIAEYWIREFDIDGWRLDVPEEIKTEGFWEEFRQRVKRVKSDAYLLGEIWHKAPTWLAGDRFDALMNYPLTEALIAFCAGDRVSPSKVKGRSYFPCPAIDAQTFGRRLSHLHSIYDWETTQVQYNLLDSHDTPRLLSLAQGDKATLRLSTLLQMTLPGAPAIYYGDEIGLHGTDKYNEPHNDADARWAFPWHDKSIWELSLLSYFKQLITMRIERPVLRRGRFEQLYAAGHCYAFARVDDTNALIVIVNVSELDQRLSLPLNTVSINGASLSSIFGVSGKYEVRGGRVLMTIPAREGLVLEVN